MKFLTKEKKEDSLDNDKALQLYREIPELRERALTEKVDYLFPQPLGPDKVSLKLVVESKLSELPTYEEVLGLERLVDSYFEKRFNAIFN